MVIHREPVARAERPGGMMSRAVGVYQMLLRRELEHFFPDALLEPAGDRSFIHPEPLPEGVNFRQSDDTDGLGIEIEWFRTRYVFLPGSPTPFLPSERRLIRSILRMLDTRFQTMFDQATVNRSDLFHYAIEDMVLTDYLDPPQPERFPAALEALRAAAMTTYENRRMSTGALLLGTPEDPALPGRPNSEGAPRYGVRLATIRGFHRLCDGVRTVFVVDHQGDILRTTDLAHWSDTVHGDLALPAPCPRHYVPHARATLRDDHVCLVLTPSQEIKVFAGGTMAFAFSDARWRLLDLPTKFETWRSAVGPTSPPDLAEKLFRVALNLAEDRHGALFVVLRDPANSMARLIPPADRIVDEVVADDPQDPDNASPRLAKRALHHVVRGMRLDELDDSLIEALAGIDGAVVTDCEGRLLTFGAILRIGAETHRVPRAVEGARTLAALASSFDGPALKVSEDGFLTMFLHGRRVWQI